MRIHTSAASSFKDVGYTQNKAVLLRNTGLSWDQSNGHDAMEEDALCAAQHLAYGRVLVKFWSPIAKHYEAGGLGIMVREARPSCWPAETSWKGFLDFSASEEKGSSPYTSGR